MVEQRLLPDPENAQRHQAHQPGHQARRQRGERCPKLGFRMNAGAVGNMDIEYQHGHGKGENAVAESGDAAKILSRDAVDMGHGANIAGPRSLVNGPS